MSAALALRASHRARAAAPYWIADDCAQEAALRALQSGVAPRGEWVVADMLRRFGPVTRGGRRRATISLHTLTTSDGEYIGIARDLRREQFRPAYPSKHRSR